MWKAWVAAAVVGVSALVAVVLVGRDLVEPKPLDSGLVALPERSWAERTGQICRESIATVRAELAGPGGLETQQEAAVRLYRETTRIQGTLVERLRELPSAPGAAKSAIELLAGQHERDRKTVARLEQTFDPRLILREIAAYEGLATRLRARFEELGAEGCVRYLDPASYES